MPEKPKKQRQLRAVPEDGLPSQLLVRQTEAAARLRLGITTIKALVKSGKLRSIKVFGARRIPVDALTEFAKNGTK